MAVRRDGVNELRARIEALRIPPASADRATKYGHGYNDAIAAVLAALPAPADEEERHDATCKAGQGPCLLAAASAPPASPDPGLLREALDVDRLARAIHRSNEHSNRPGCLDMDRDTAEYLAREYAALAAAPSEEKP